jgi:hypothetical protein
VTIRGCSTKLVIEPPARLGRISLYHFDRSSETTAEQIGIKAVLVIFDQCPLWVISGR